MWDKKNYIWSDLEARLDLEADKSLQVYVLTSILFHTYEYVIVQQQLLCCFDTWYGSLS